MMVLPTQSQLTNNSLNDINATNIFLIVMDRPVYITV